MEENEEFEVVAINDLTDAEQLAYLLKYDTSHRCYRVDEISHDEDEIIVGGRHIKVYAETDPANLPWAELGIDQVFECTGRFKGKADAGEEDPEQTHGVRMGNHPGQGLGHVVQPDGLGGPQDHQGGDQQPDHGK